MGRFTRSKDEKGATLVIVTLSTIVLFGFAALAVDVGHGMGERRRAQGTADASVLAAAVEVNLPGTTLQDLVTEAVNNANANAPTPFVEDDWLNNCPDTVNPADQLEHTAAELNLNPATDCISFSANFREIRVSLPQQIVDTIFAGVIGIDTLDVTAFAHAHLGLPGLADSPPFVVTNGNSGGDVVCLRASSVNVRLPARWLGNNNQEAAVGDYDINGDPIEPDPCDDLAFPLDPQIQGNFFTFRYNDGCSRSEGANPEGVPLEIAAGVDHQLGTFAAGYSNGSPEALEGGPLPPPTCLTAFPNTVELNTGDLGANNLMRGLLTTSAATPRLKLNPANIDGTQFAGEVFDNKPLWDYLLPGVTGACARARNGTGPPNPYDFFDRKEDLLACLSTANSVIFDADIATASRFAWLPYLAESQLAVADPPLLPGPRREAGSSYLHINSFVAIYFQTLYQVGQQGGQSDECWTQHPDASQGWSRHDAGQPFNCGQGSGVHAVSAIVIPCRALPETICTDDGITGTPGGFPVLVIELIK